tara:strand:+ start:3712 stop:4902 length:1191 start_codon:yes stop_codon:yes gene_type:complete
MRSTFIKKLDLYLGKLLCSILTFWRKTAERDYVLMPKSILFIKLIEQGATVLAYSAIKEAVNQVGREHVYFVLFKENRPVLDFMNLIPNENIYELRNDSFGNFLHDFISFLLAIRKKKVEAAIDMEFFSRSSAIMAYLSGAKYRVGLHRFNAEQPYRGDLLTHRLNYNPFLHISKYYLLLVKVLGESPFGGPELKHLSSQNLQISTPNFHAREEAIQNMKAKIGEKQLAKKLVILNPNASDMLTLRKWSQENFEELAQLLSKQKDVHLIFTGIAKEKHKVEEICASIKEEHYINLAGETSFEELMALYQLASVLVTNDSGPAHFASLVNCPTVVLFGPETPSLFSPIGENVEIVYKNLACSPCVNVYNHRFSPCKNNLCMQNIGVHEVLEKVKRFL